MIIGEIWGICGKPSDHNWDKANCMIQFKWKKYSKHEISTASISLKQTILHIGAQNYKGTSISTLSILPQFDMWNFRWKVPGSTVAVVTLKKVCK